MSGPSPSASGVTFSANEIALLDAGAKFEKVKVLGSTNDRATVMGRDHMTREVESKKLLKLSNDLRFVQNDEAFYEMGGRIERCRIVEVHQDAPDEEPYFTIRLSNTGRERTTDSPHLLKPLEARSGESAGGGEASDDPFSELVGGDVAVSSSTASTAIPSDFGKFRFLHSVS